MIADISLPSAHRKKLIVGLNSLTACAVLQSLMSFDLASPRCDIEYEYCLHVADLDVMPEHNAPEEVSLALLYLSKPILRVGGDGMPREGDSKTDRNFAVP